MIDSKGPRAGIAGFARPALIVWLIAGGLLAGSLAYRAVGSRSVLPVMGTVPEFDLVDQNHQEFGSGDLRGRPWVASFIYTTCPGPCPRVVRKMADLDRRISSDPRVSLVSFSVDPSADTPEVLHVYGETHGVNPRRWKLLTGPVDDVYALIRKGFFLSVAENSENVAVAPEDGPIVHSVRLVLIDDAMRIRGYYDSEDALEMKKMAEDTGRLAAGATR